ncbi:MAG: trimeric intracellular cation channel family protein [Balneolaceae bacterium]|nr:trimeric intracellular cation channel family protein [Balneolaceae bacterium]
MMLYWFDLFGVIVFAITGSLAAGKNRLDLFGGLVLALVTALGGGTLRDLILGKHPIFWISDLTYIYFVAATALIVFVIARYKKLPERTLLIADAFGLAIFSVLGAQVAIQEGVPGLVAVIMGMLTGVAGGIIRDILSNQIPLILRQEIYATAALTGATVYVFLHQISDISQLNLALAAAVTLVLRLAAIKWKFSLPTFLTNQDKY